MTIRCSLRLMLAAGVLLYSSAARSTAQNPAAPAPATDQAAGVEQSAAPKPVPLTLEQRGDLLMARKMFREAIDIFRQGFSQPNGYVLYNKVGIAYHHMLDFKAAKKNYETALKRNPKYAEARNNLGALYYAQKNYRRAISEYQKALKLNPNSATIYSNLGTAYFARKKYEDATKAYQQALALDPEVFEQRGTAGSILQERSIEELAKFHYYLAKTYAQAGNTEYAMRYIRRSLEEGFKDKKKYLEEPEFGILKDLPEFQQLMTMEIRVL
jgi:tetratricopeptide (TPR) repeat protein